MMLLLLTHLSFAGALDEGATAFDAGDLDAAIEAWSSVDKTPSGRVLYDLGNAWYRKGDAPRAVAYFRAAKQRRPRDGNVHHNLALARSELSSVPAPVSDPQPWMEMVTVGELGVFATGTCAIGSIGLLWVFRRREQQESMGFLVPSLVWLGGLALAVTATLGSKELDAHPIGVIVDRDAAARELPRADAEVRITWGPGTELQVIDRGMTWVLAEDGRGRRGWVSDTSMLVVWPRP